MEASSALFRHFMGIPEGTRDARLQEMAADATVLMGLQAIFDFGTSTLRFVYAYSTVFVVGLGQYRHSRRSATRQP